MTRPGDASSIILCAIPSDGPGRVRAELLWPDGDTSSTGEGETAEAALADLVFDLHAQLELAAEYTLELGGDEDGFRRFARRLRAEKGGD